MPDKPDHYDTSVLELSHSARDKTEDLIPNPHKQLIDPVEIEAFLYEGNAEKEIIRATRPFSAAIR